MTTHIPARCRESDPQPTERCLESLDKDYFAITTYSTKGYSFPLRSRLLQNAFNTITRPLLPHPQEAEDVHHTDILPGSQGSG